MHRFILVLIGLTAFSLTAYSENELARTARVEASYLPSGIEWSVFVPSAGMVLTVSGPDGQYWKQAYSPDVRPRLAVLDEKGVPRREGLYRWELVVQLPARGGGDQPDEPNPVVSGSFEISGSTIIPKRNGAQPAMVEEGAPANSLFVDREGRVGVGTSVPRSMLHLKGANPALTVEDTTTGGRTHTLRGLEKGDGSLGLFDETAGLARWLVDAEGRVGVNTTTPTSTLTVDGYIESTKGFLVNGRPIGGIGFGLSGGSQPLFTEVAGKAIFGTGAGSVDTAVNVAFFGANAGHSNTTGTSNAFFGQAAGYANTTGGGNTFVGDGAGYLNTTASDNTAFGYAAGHYNVTGIDNAFFGSEAGVNTTSSCNSFFGRSAGYNNTTGSGNAFFGTRAGDANATGYANDFFGFSTGVKNTTGAGNSFFGDMAGPENTTGDFNSFFGKEAGWSNTAEDLNTFIGALSNGASGITNATALGFRASVTQSNSLVLGGVSGSNGVTVETRVGIGTTAPDRQLVVEGSQAVGKFRRYSATTPTHAPAFLFERARGTNTAPADILPGDYLGKVQFRARVGPAMPEYGALAFIASDTSQNGRFSFIDRDLVTERMVILNTGNVGIGTNSPTALLDVAGNLRVRGTILYGAPAVAVPDYVFEPDYPLMPLGELHSYLKKEKHLPNVPKATDIQQKGVDLGELQMKLLEKIEELTLYTLQQAEIIERQKERAAIQEEKAATQERRIKALEEMVNRLVKER